jgi:hypothetical protein
MTKFPFWLPPRRENPSYQRQTTCKTFLRGTHRSSAGSARARPIEKIGYSIFIYDLTDDAEGFDEAGRNLRYRWAKRNKLSKELSLPELEFLISSLLTISSKM